MQAGVHWVFAALGENPRCKSEPRDAVSLRRQKLHDSEGRKSSGRTVVVNLKGNGRGEMFYSGIHCSHFNKTRPFVKPKKTPQAQE